MSGKSSRDKGARYERELAALLREGTGHDVKRGMVFYHESDLTGLPGIHIECKAVERLNIRQAFHQATEEALIRNDGRPVVFHHKARDGWLATMSLDLFMELYTQGDRNASDRRIYPPRP